MKKSLSILVAIILVMSLFTGCNKDKKANTTSKVELTSEYENSTELVGDPNATGELTVGVYGTEPSEKNLDMFCMAVEKFKKLYPKVILNIDRVSYETEYKTYQNKLWKSVQDGTSPDLFINYRNIEAFDAIKNNLIADMSSYFEKDSTFQSEEYNQAVLNCNDHDGKKFIIPLGYSMPLLISTKTILKEHKFDVNQCTDFYSTTDALYELANNASTDEKPLSRLSWNIFPVSIGLNFIDYDSKTVSLSSMKNKECEKKLSKLSDYCMFDNYDEEWIDKLKQKKTVIVQLRDGLQDPINSYQSINTTDEAVIFPWRNANGNIQARLAYDNIMVSNSSKNKQNAYFFIKVMLSKDIQLLSEFGGSYKQFIPISSYALKEYLKKKLLSEEALSISTNRQKTESDAIKFINDFIDLTNQVDGVDNDLKICSLFAKSMLPFYEDQKSYEECVKDAESKIQAYVFG
ncbi:extracellular solute-binding protein [Paludicola sp. MB14-C6]|uniref:ABC transporter substrate-binding protein n=1 Tax=Paludihabitans sp. MB14-C6 TaxID=3070656 RepID=UPI0027DE7274|nr:extracellular solute-binding protein [Paludicola sp. MB14-C6]WMJ23083.1 extracellular solute-binding protein [Paludicola sp. MB14-C6]